MGPDVAVAIDALDDGDLGQQRVADLFLPPFVGQECLEPPVLGPGLLQARLQHVELAEIVEVEQAQQRDHQDPGTHRAHKKRVLDLGAQLLEDAQIVQQSLQGIAGALPPLARFEIDSNHESTDPWVGVRLRYAERVRSAASAAGPLRPPAWSRRRPLPPATSRSGWRAAPES